MGEEEEGEALGGKVGGDLHTSVQLSEYWPHCGRLTQSNLESKGHPVRSADNVPQI